MRRFQLILLVGITFVGILTSWGESVFWRSYKEVFGWSEFTWALKPYVEVSLTVLWGILLVLVVSSGPRREVSLLRRVVGKMRDGELKTRVDVNLLSMTAPVGLALNEMADQTQALIEEQETLLQSVAHETRTPLARMRFILEKMSGTENTSTWPTYVQDMDAEVTELEELIAHVLDAAKTKHKGANGRQVYSVQDLIQPLLQVLQKQHPETTVEWSGLSGEDTSVCVESFGFERALRNLLSNGFEACRRTLRIHIARTDDVVIISVEDDGIGIPRQDRLRVFEPFVRLTPDGKASGGRGLGLNIVMRVAKSYGHTVVVGESDLGGARLETRWPAG